MMDINEVIVISVFAVLTVAVMVLSALLARLIPLLHDSVSASNLAPLYDALLPVAAKYASVGLGVTGRALKEAAERTPNKVDDELATYLDARFEALIALMDANRDGGETVEASVTVDE